MKSKEEAAKPGVSNKWCASFMNLFHHSFLSSFCRFLFLFDRWTTLSLSCAGMRTSLYPAVEFAAAPPQSRRPAGTGQEPAVSVRHLRQRIRHRVLTPHPHGQGKIINPPQKSNITKYDIILHNHLFECGAHLVIVQLRVCLSVNLIYFFNHFMSCPYVCPVPPPLHPNPMRHDSRKKILAVPIILRWTK